MLCHPVGNHSLSSTSDNVTKSSSNLMHRVYSSGVNKGIRSFQISSSRRSSFEISDDNTKSDTFRLKRSMEEQGVDRLGEERSFDGNESCYNVAGRYGLTTPAINPALSSIEEFDGAEEGPQGQSKADAKYITAVATRPPAKRPPITTAGISLQPSSGLPESRQHSFGVSPDLDAFQISISGI